VFCLMSGCREYLVIFLRCDILSKALQFSVGGGEKHILDAACVLKICSPVCGIYFVPKVGV